MDDDMRKSLLTNKGVPFQKLYEECLVKIQRIKQKNDFLQRQVGEDMEDTIATEIKKQRKFLQAEIQQLKDIMDEIETRFKDPESRNKLKSVKGEAQKQIQRNKIILKDLISKSFLKRSQGHAEQHDDDQGAYMEGGRIHYDNFASNNTGKASVITDRSQDRQFQDQVDMDYQIERKMLQEKQQLLDEVQQSTMRVNAIVTDMAIEVDEQGQNLDVIEEQLLTAKKNVELANQNLIEANQQSKKSRKKYICLVALILALVGLAIGLFFILTKKK